MYFSHLLYQSKIGVRGFSYFMVCLSQRGPCCQRCLPFLSTSTCGSKDRKVLRRVLRVRVEWSFRCVPLPYRSGRPQSIFVSFLCFALETHGRLSPRVSLHGRLTYSVDVSTRLLRVFIFLQGEPNLNIYRSEVLVGIWDGTPKICNRFVLLMVV